MLLSSFKLFNKRPHAYVYFLDILADLKHSRDMEREEDGDRDV
jgi:hypothetical protein